HADRGPRGAPDQGAGHEGNRWEPAAFGRGGVVQAGVVSGDCGPPASVRERATRRAASTTITTRQTIIRIVADVLTTPMTSLPGFPIIGRKLFLTDKKPAVSVVVATKAKGAAVTQA